MRRPALPLALVVAVALLAGCSANGGDDDAEDPSTPDAQGSQAVDETVEDLQAAAGENADPIPVPEDLPVIATRTTTSRSVPLEIELNSVTASGKVMTVVFTVRNTGTEEWTIGTFFDDGSERAPLDDAGALGDARHSLVWTTDGVVVLDPVNGRLHRAAYDSAGHCACNIDLIVADVAPGEAMVLTTAFAAPPEDVTHVTVQIPGAGSFDDVPLQGR